MQIINNFSDIFSSVWKQGILGVDIFQILIGIGIFFIFLVFRGLISKLIIKKLEIISKRTTNKLDDTFVHALVGPARFLPIVLGFFIASYYPRRRRFCACSRVCQRRIRRERTRATTNIERRQAPDGMP